MADPEHIRTILSCLFEDPGGDVANAHEIYHDDAVLEFPQSGERFEGVDTFTAWRGQYPADVTFRIRRIDRFRGFLPRRAVGCVRRGPRDDGSANPGLPRRQGDSGADLCHRALGSPRVARALALDDARGIRLIGRNRHVDSTVTEEEIGELVRRTEECECRHRRYRNAAASAQSWNCS